MNVQELLSKISALTAEKRIFSDAIAAVNSATGDVVKITVSGTTSAPSVFVPKAPLRQFLKEKIDVVDAELVTLESKLNSVNSHLKALP